MFNTGSRGTYLDLLFITLHYPQESVVRFEYSQGNCIPFDRLYALAQTGKEDVLMSLLDMQSPSISRYIPLRFGLLEGVSCINERVFINVKLKGYCHATDMRQYTSFISTISPSIYDMHEGADGWSGLLVEDADVKPMNNVLVSTQSSWINTVRALSNRTLFANCFSVFTKMTLTDEKGNLMEVRSVDGSGCSYQLQSNKTYHLLVSHFAPRFEYCKTSRIHLSIQDTDNLLKIASASYVIGNSQSEHEFTLRTRRSDVAKSTTIAVQSLETQVDGLAVRYASAPIGIEVKSYIANSARGALILLCVITMTIATWLLSLPVADVLKDLQPGFTSGSLSSYELMLYSLCTLLDEGTYVYTFICSGLVSISTLGMVHFYGKPKLGG